MPYEYLPVPTPNIPCDYRKWIGPGRSHALCSRPAVVLTSSDFHLCHEHLLDDVEDLLVEDGRVKRIE